MQSKRWFMLLLSCVTVIFLGIVALNLLADPFGVFGDPLFKWPSANMTNNPKTAKFTYIDERVGEFEGFIIGPSGSSGLSPQTAEKYTGLKFYNMFNYGADMAYTRRLARYLIENHAPKHIILDMPVITASVYDIPPDDITYEQPLKNFWRLPFLLADPKFALKKAYNFTRNGYVQQDFTVFNPLDGTYDKTRRETEPIGGMADYLEAYPEFANMPTYSIALNHIDENLDALREIKALCDANNIELTVLVQPMLTDEINQYNKAEVEHFLNGMAGVTPYWNFANTAISQEPRYFYDTTHYRNAVGDMMLAKIFGDGSIYMPQNFGAYVTAGSDLSGTLDETAPQRHETAIPILMYHNLAETGDGGETISAENFREHMAALADAGANTVTVNDMYNYVHLGVELPPKPVLITFDDGYLSNYELAFPILKEFNHKATIFVIGTTFGQSEYKDTAKKITPHFGEKEAAEMVASGLITLGSHTFDMHQVEGFDPAPRHGILMSAGETEREYINTFKQDFMNERKILNTVNNKATSSSETFGGETSNNEGIALAYPFGLWDDLSAVLLNELGIEATFTTEYGKETIIKGLPASLLGLKRIAAGDDMTGEDVQALLQ